MNHSINVLFETVVYYMARVALRTLFGTAFPEAAEIGSIFGFLGGILGNFSIQEVHIVLRCYSRFAFRRFRSMISDLDVIIVLHLDVTPFLHLDVIP